MDMTSVNTPLLITTALNPPEGIPFLKMTDSSRRKILSKAALYNWIGKGVTHIVIADATDSCLLSESEISELSLMGVVIEQIRFQQDIHRTRLKGKGYGEGRLIEFALENSRLLEDATHFYKSTGKTFVRNFKTIQSMVGDNTMDLIFWKYPDIENFARTWADTRFFFTSVDFAVQHLIPSYLESSDESTACEYVIFHKLNEHCIPAAAQRPLVCGFSGGLDAEYFDGTLGYLDLNFPCWHLPKGV
jgi:hypothetical protein